MSSESYPTNRSETKICRECGEAKPRSDFPKNRRDGKEYCRPYCKPCYNAKQRERAVEPGKMARLRPFQDPETGVTMKRCSTCDEAKPIDDFGWISKERGRRRSKCRMCDAALKRQAYWENPEHFRSKAKEYAERHPEKVRERKLKWYYDNHEQRIEYHRQNNIKRRDQQREYFAEYRLRVRDKRIANSREWHAKNTNWSREYYTANKQRYSEYGRQWRLENPDKHAEIQQRRRAREQSASVIEHVDRLAIIERDSSTCYLCGQVLDPKSITIDHVMPLSRGGAHAMDNLRVCCQSCNSRKGAKTYDEYIARYGLTTPTDEPSQARC